METSVTKEQLRETMTKRTRPDSPEALAAALMENPSLLEQAVLALRTSHVRVLEHLSLDEGQHAVHGRAQREAVEELAKRLEAAVDHADTVLVDWTYDVIQCNCTWCQARVADRN